MALPVRVQNLIHEYARPITRSDWRKGSLFNRLFKYSTINKRLHTNALIKFKTTELELDEHTSFIEDIQQYGEMVYLDTYYKQHNLIYKNYYFMLIKIGYFNKSNSINYLYEYNNIGKRDLSLYWYLVVD